jgi:hypothetical protein
LLVPTQLLLLILPPYLAHHQIPIPLRVQPKAQEITLSFYQLFPSLLLSFSPYEND